MIHITRSLTNIIEYLYETEKKHWEEMNKPRNHIYYDIKLIKNWLELKMPDLDY